MKVELKNICWDIGGLKIIRDVSINAGHRKFIAVVGPNGSGKSSLLRLIYRFYWPKSGAIFIDEGNIKHLNSAELAQKEAVVTQERNIDYDFNVYEIVMMARFPHKKIFQNYTDKDDKIVRNSLKHVGMLSHSQRLFATLSGGEKQRVLLARALAQESEVLVLDEPTNHLDPFHQIKMMHLVKKLGFTTIAAMHDLNMAAAYSDYVYLLKKGKIIAFGTPAKVFSRKNIKLAYGVSAEVRRIKKSGRLSIVFTGF